MNLDSLSFALSDISYSIANLTKKNYKTSVQEITRLVAQHGLEAERHLLRCLFSHVDFSGDGKSSGKDFHQTQYLIQECATLISKPNFISVFCYAIDNPLHHQKSLKPSSQLLSQLSKVLKLNRAQEVVFGLALLYSSISDLRQYATQFVKQKFPDLLRSYIDSDSAASQEGGLNDCSPEVLHLLLTHLLQGPKDQFGIGIEQKEAFLNTLRKDFPRERVPVILAPALYQYELDTTMDSLVSDSSAMSKTVEGSLSELIREMGYGFTASAEECRNALMHLGFREISPSVVARILSMMARTHVGLTDPTPIQSMNSGNGSLWNDKEKLDGGQLSTWNADAFVQALHEMFPSLEWKEVVYELDHPGFLLKDRQGFKLLWQALMHGLGCNSFPVEHIFRQWRNAEGQLSLFQQLLANYDVVSLTTFNCRLVNTEVLKAPPEDDSPAIGNWKCLDLIGTLLYLSDTGHYSQVQELFKFPMQHCPDLLVLGLVQLPGLLNLLRQELLTSLMPIFLGNHPNGAIVIHYAWNYQAHASYVRPIIMHAMAEWYLRGEHDQTRLSRILDVAQDLKALSVLLNGSSFPFVIDLACLASRREYLKLDKWLTDKIREHGEKFVQESVAFLKRRCPQILGGLVKEETLPKSAQLPPETLATMLACLQTCAGNVAQELSETILTMVGNCSILLNKPRQPPPGVVKTARGLEPAFSASSINAPTNSMDPLSGLAASVAGLSLGSTGNTTINSVPPIFPIGTSLNSFPNPTSGSPAKLLSTPTPSTPSVSSVTQNPFSSIMPPLSTQISGQFNTQNLGLSTSTSMSAGISSVTTKGMLGHQNVDRLRQGDMSGIFPEITQQVSKEIEDEANSYFQRIYNHPPHPTLSIDEVLDMLKRFQESPVKREREVFSCMIRNLFEEYRFFPQYPDKELLITAQLFGGIIEQGLVTYMALGLALRYVLDALKRTHNTKMYYFGITALDRFKSRLKDYSQYCQHLASIPHFQDFPSHLIEYVEYGARSQEPPSRPQGPVLPQLSSGFGTIVSTAVRTVTSTVSTVTTTVAKQTITGKPSIANATSIDTLLVATEKDDKIVPPESVQDKVAFIINNLAQVNLSQKTEEFKDLVKEDYWPWASQYLVMKRASIEANFHSLYSNFLDTLKIFDLTKLVIKETFRNIKVLLRSDKGIANFSDRSLLKNLGHWLGMLTLAKNKPILQIDIDIKALLIEAYHKGQQELLYVVPFVAKVLESCAKSKVFRPPNPWTMGIMCVLAELHQEPELKLNLKFEIEVLCKTLSLDINELKPSTILKDYDRVSRIEPQLSPLTKQKETSLIREVQQQQQVQLQPVSTHIAPQSTPSIAVSIAASEENISVPPGRNTPTPTGTGNASTPIPTSVPQPLYSYHEINISPSTLGQHIRINEQITLLQNHPHLKRFVKPAIERAVQEWIPAVVERTLKISLTTCEQIVKKDFALDPEEQRMRVAAHHMVRNLTAGMAMITCRDPLVNSIATNLRSAFTNALPIVSNTQQKELAEQAVQTIAQENVELACCFIQKTTVEKAIPEIDKRLSAEYEVRKHARGEGRRYCDPLVLTYQAERMPEQIRLKVGGVTAQQMAVYEEFARNIPGFMPNCEREPPSFISKPVSVMQPYATDDATQIYDKVIAELEHYIRSVMANPGNPQAMALHNLLETMIVTRNSHDVVSAAALVRKAVEGLLEGLTQQLSTDPELTIRFREGHLLVLKALADPRVSGIQWTVKQVTRSLIECREEYRYNIDAVDCLIRNHLVNLQAFDIFISQAMDNGMNYMATAFAISLVKMYFIEDRQNGCVSDSDLCNTIESLVHIANHPRQQPEGLSQLLDVLRTLNEQTFTERVPGGPMSMMHSGISQAREFDDPPGLHEKTEYLLREWVNMFHSSTAGRDSTKAFTVFVHQGILKNDDLITRFFRLSTEMCVDLCYRALADQPTSSPTLIRAKCFHTLDAYVRLISLLVKHSGDAQNTVTKINLLNKVLGIVAGVLLQDHEIRSTEFQQLPYHRIFIMLFLELSAPEPILEAINFQVTTAFCNTLHVLRPGKAPGFAYAWLELVSHRVFLGRILALTPQQKAWSLYSQLLVHLFKFLAPFLKNVELAKPVQLLYKGTLRVLLVLLHDFPEFLCDCHYSFCDVIPPNCIQMRNLILSAFPRNMRLPDPFTPNLKVDMLPEITQAPRVLTNFSNLVLPQNFKKDLDSYIKTRSPVTFLSELRSSLQLSNEAGVRYNIPLMNALVLYVGTQAISYIQSKGLTSSMSTITHSSHMDIFQNLAVDLDTEGRYLFLNAIANQLRYPNSHTHYFSCTLLYLFAEANTEAIQEQITRVLLERLIVNRPHPWGLLVTFIELIKNPTFKFWNHEFVRCAPEIEKLFESVARSCVQQKTSGESGTS